MPTAAQSCSRNCSRSRMRRWLSSQVLRVTAASRASAMAIRAALESQTEGPLMRADVGIGSCSAAAVADDADARPCTLIPGEGSCSTPIFWMSQGGQQPAPQLPSPQHAPQHPAQQVMMRGLPSAHRLPQVSNHQPRSGLSNEGARCPNNRNCSDLSGPPGSTRLTRTLRLRSSGSEGFPDVSVTRTG